MDVAQIDQLWHNKYGWLGPSGQLLVCGLWEHFSALHEVPQLAQAVRDYEHTVESNNNFMHECLSQLGDDEHPEMHRFGGMNDDARDQLIRTAYEAGWVRLGLTTNRSMWGQPSKLSQSDPTMWVVEAEGLKSSLIQVDRHLRRIQKHLQCQLQLAPVQWMTLNKKGLEICTRDPF